MKRILLLSVVVGLFAGQAFAGLYEINAPLARQFTVQATSGAVEPLPPPDMGNLHLVIDNPGTSGSTKYVNDGVLNQYGEIMKYQVGFVGDLADNNGNGISWITIGKVNPGLTGSYTGFAGAFSNDNDDPWLVRVYAYAGNTLYLGAQTFMTTHSTAFLTVDFGSSLDVATLTQVGFNIMGNFVLGGSPSNPDAYHLSVVPVPAALLLGLLGLGAAGVKLRRFA
jgi:hypothetical protein